MAQISATPSSVRASTVSTLASMSVPMPTTARPNSATPSWRSASSSVESAWTTWVSRSDHSLDQLGVLVDAEHLVPEADQRVRDLAAEAAEADDDHAVARACLAVASQRWVAPLDSGRAGGRLRSARADATAIVPTRPTNMSMTSTTWAGAGRLGVMPVERPTVAKAEVASNSACSNRTGPAVAMRASVPTATRATPSRATVRACRCTVLGDAPPSDHDVRLAPDLGPDDVGEQQERGHLDAAGGAGAAAADEHQRDHDGAGLQCSWRRSRRWRTRPSGASSPG